jgi:RNase P/RNase MRP subunit p29
MAVSIVMVFFCTGLSFAWLVLEAGNNSMVYVITGTVEKIGRNTIDIRDEDDKVLKRFVYFDTDVQIGERVRIHYEPRSGRVDRLKKMTVVEYKKDGQNLGYISKDVSSGEQEKQSRSFVPGE